MGIPKLETQTLDISEETMRAAEAISYKKWSKLMWQAYDKEGMIGVLALAADIVEQYDAIAAAAEEEQAGWPRLRRTVIAAQLVIEMYEPALVKIHEQQQGYRPVGRERGTTEDGRQVVPESSAYSDTLNAHIDRLDVLEDKKRMQAGNPSTENCLVETLRKRILH